MTFNKAAFCRGLTGGVLTGLMMSLIGDFIYGTWFTIMQGIFKIFIFVFMIIFEFIQTPPVVKGFSFMYNFFGRGIFYIVFGFISMVDVSAAVAGNILIIFVGAIYIILHLTNKGREPEYMSYDRYFRLNGGIAHELPSNTADLNQQHQPHPHDNMVSPQLPVYTEYPPPSKISVKKQTPCHQEINCK